MTKLLKIYYKLFAEYGPQGWWPIINPETLICEYNGGPRTDEERFEVMVGAVLAQNTQWYPNVVRAIQQLKLGRPFTEKELEEIRGAERLQGRMFEKPKNMTKSEILTQNRTLVNTKKVIIGLNKNNLINPKKLLVLGEEKLAQIIRPAGYYNQKAKKLIFLSDYILKNSITKLMGQKTIILRKNLLEIKGVGPETADSIILYALNKPIPVVDAYTTRIFVRIGLINEKSLYCYVQEYQKNNFFFDSYKLEELHALLVIHAKNVCTKSGPDCWMCKICDLCDKNY